MARKTNPMNRRRKQKTRESYLALIVTEGQKTEVNYLNDLIEEYEISEKVRILKRGSDSHPLSVAKAAIEEKERMEAGGGEGYTKIFCVIDRDEHKNFDKAKQKMKNNGLTTIISVPCIEYWFLLHFGYVRSPFMRTGKNSPADVCVSALKKNIPKYDKALPGLFKNLLSKLKTAKKNSKMALNDAIATGNDNPSTQMHELIEELEKLRA